MAVRSPKEWSPRGLIPGTILWFIDKYGITMTYKAVPMNPAMSHDPWAQSAYHYRVTFRKGRKRLSDYFSKGQALPEPPEAEEVLDSMADDVAGFVNSGGDFEGWVAEYGIPEEGERDARRVFRLLESLSERLAEFLGHDAYDELLWEIKR